LIVFTSDHGEVLYRPDSQIEWTHSCAFGCLEPEALNIPLIIRPPQRPPQHIYANVTRSMDVFPTMAGLCDLKISSNAVDGLDLSSAVVGESEKPNLTAFSCSELSHPNVGNADPSLLAVQARIGDLVYKVPYGKKFQKMKGYDLTTHDSIAFDETVDTRLRAYKAQVVRNYKISAQIPTDEVLEKLRSLGYIK